MLISKDQQIRVIEELTKQANETTSYREATDILMTRERALESLFEDLRGNN